MPPRRRGGAPLAHAAARQQTRRARGVVAGQLREVRPRAHASGLLQHLRKANGFGDELDNAAEHKLRLLKAKADVADIEAKKAAGEYVAIDEVERTWADLAIRFRQRTLYIAHRAARLVAVEGSAAACHRIIEGLIYEALNELASTPVEAATDET